MKNNLSKNYKTKKYITIILSILFFQIQLFEKNFFFHYNFENYFFFQIIEFKKNKLESLS